MPYKQACLNRKSIVNIFLRTLNCHCQVHPWFPIRLTQSRGLRKDSLLRLSAMPPSLRILLLGSGGREHALAWKLAQSSLIDRIFVAPGNGGTLGEQKTTNVDIDISASNFNKLVKFALDNDVNLVVPGPEQPLTDGVELVFRKGALSISMCLHEVHCS